MNRKRILSMGLACIMAAAMSVTAFAESKIFVDLQEVQTDTPPQIVNDRTMVPVRAITEMIGYDVEWIDDKQQVEVYVQDTSAPVIVMNIGNTTALYTKYDNIGLPACFDQ